MNEVLEKKHKIVEQALFIIKRELKDYNEIGLFGSFARGKASASSDVDIYVITALDTDRRTKAILRCDLEELNADIVFLTEDYIRNNMEHLLIKNIIRDRVILERRDESDIGGTVL